MSVEKLKERRQQLITDMEALQKKVNDLRNQIDSAESTIRQWTDTLLIQRGQLLEMDNMIAELDSSDEVPEEKSKKKGGS